jgi:hypothetical protein
MAQSTVADHERAHTLSPTCQWMKRTGAQAHWLGPLTARRRSGNWTYSGRSGDPKLA